MNYGLKCGVALLISVLSNSAATFSFVYTDPPNFGYNDATPASPVGGNTGTTLGEQRRILLERAASSWANYLESDVTIVIEADFLQLGGSQFSATLAFAGPNRVHANFPGAPESNVWYVSALADSLRSADNDSGNPDIGVTVNESIDSDPNVLGGDGFYYGLDNETPSNQSDLFSTLLHEIGHGLGFLSTVAETTVTDGQTVFQEAGALLSGLPDSFTLRMYDEETDKAWPDMTLVERQASLINDPNLTFRGPATQQAMLRQLKPENGGVVVHLVDSNGDILATYDAQSGSFGWGTPPWGVSGALVLADDGVSTSSDACEAPFVNADEIRGRIALIDRGNCNFDDKVLRAQEAGAIAAIIVNNAGNNLVSMFGNDEDIIIPSFFIGQDDGTALKASLPGAIVRMDTTGDLSATNEGSPRIFAPDPVDQGSSISHWSSDAYPDLLMEPFISDSRLPELDLSVIALRDIGWRVKNIRLPYFDYALWANEQITVSASGATEDADGDGTSNFGEYVFGSDPMLATDTPASPSITPSPNASNLYEIDFLRNRLAADVVFSIQRTSDLNIQSTEAVNGLDYVLNDEIGLSGDRVQTQLDLSSVESRGFFRIEVDAYQP